MRPAFDALMVALEDVASAVDEQTAEGADSGESGGFELQFANVESIDVTRQLEKGSRSELLSRLRSKWDITFPQSTVWGILGCVAGFSISIVRERTRGTLTRLETAPIRRTQILMGKGLACFLAVSMVIVVMTTIGYGLGMRPRSFPLLILATAFIAFCFVGLMMAIAVLGKTEEAVGGTGWAINMVMAMFGGGMVPLMFLPQFMQKVSHLSPVKWAVLAMEGAIWRGFTLTEMLPALAILAAVGLGGIAFGSLHYHRTAA